MAKKVVTTESVIQVTNDVPIDPIINSEPKPETFCSILRQVALPIVLAGFAMVEAGVYFEYFESWDVMKKVPELIILIPSLLGLKGNLEMTLASRLSTAANLGKLSSRSQQWQMIVGNMALIQGILIGLLSAGIASGLVLILKGSIQPSHVIMLVACSITTASVASFVLGLMTISIVLLSLKLNLNPDNVTTPIAASVGDITSLLLLSYIALGYGYCLEDKIWIPTLISVLLCLSVIFWAWIANKNRGTRNVLKNGWVPIIMAMIISTLGGLALEKSLKEFKGLAAFQPLLNGVGGNIVSIQASRLSTALHQCFTLGELPSNIKIFISPWNTYASPEPHALSSRALLFLVIPCDIIFVFILIVCQFGMRSMSQEFLLFILLFLVAAIIQVTILLNCAYILTHFFWKRGTNPDNSTIPYLTALGDVLGIVLLGGVYIIQNGIQGAIDMSIAQYP